MYDFGFPGPHIGDKTPIFLPADGVEEMVPQWLDKPRPFQLEHTNLVS